MKGPNNKYKHPNNNKYQANQAQFKGDTWKNDQGFQETDYYQGQPYENNQKYQSYGQFNKPYQNQPQKKYGQYNDYQQDNSNGRQVNEELVYGNQKDNKQNKYRCAKHTIQNKQHKQTTGSEYNQYHDFQGSNFDGYRGSGGKHEAAGYDQYDNRNQRDQFKAKPNYGHYDQYYYEEDYQQSDYHQSHQTPSKTNKFNKFYAQQKHQSDRKTRQKQHSMNTTNSFSSGTHSGSQEGKNGSNKKSAGSQKHYHHDTRDDYSTTQISYQGGPQQNNYQQRYQRRNYVCYVCKVDLKDLEKEFYPCNCKYQICYDCYYHQVDHKDRKCPNCGKHYEVSRVEEYKQSKMLDQTNEDESMQMQPAKEDDQEYGPEMAHQPCHQHEEAISIKGSKYIAKVKQTIQQSPQIQQNDETAINQQKILQAEFNHNLNQNNQEPFNYQLQQDQQAINPNQQHVFGPSPMIKFEIQSHAKIIKTDEDIPLVSNLISPALRAQEEKLAKDQSVQEKYDLVVVNKNNAGDGDDNQSINNCYFQQVTMNDPDDSECHIDMMSMRSTQTQRQNFIAKSNQQGVLRRMNSQENILTSQSVLNHTNSQMSHNGYTKSMTNNQSSEQKERIHPAIKGIKLSKIRIIQKSTVYVIGLSPALADENLMRTYEYFGQYGKILQIVINKDAAFTSSIKEDGGAESIQSTSSNKSQKSYAAYITYSSPQDASLAIMALDQFIFDNRLIRASYGRTKYCKFFLKNQTCNSKDCPYKHSESKEQDILTPDDMQKKALFQYCIQLAIQMSLITDMNESQFKDFLKHKRDQRNQWSNSKHVLPSIESIFDNKDLHKKINQFKTCLLSANKKKAGLMDEKLKNAELSKKQLQNVANKVSRELRFQNSAMEKRTTKDKVTMIKKPRSGSNNQNEIKQTKPNLIGPEQIKAQDRQAIRHSIPRIFSQSNQEIRIQDLKNQHKKAENNITVTNYLEQQKKQQLQQGFKHLQANVNDNNKQVPNPRTNRLMSKEDDTLAAAPIGKDAQVKATKNVDKSNSKSQSRNRRRFGSFVRDRQKSASKSIQRQTSVSSLIDYTLKFLNDDMAIDLTKLRIEDPLIEKSVEEDKSDNQSQINKMIFQNQQNQEQFDGRSSIFSNYENRSHPVIGEVNLGKINNIYTSPFFLINSEKTQNDKNESVKNIWENFDNIGMNINKQHSDYRNMQQFDSMSYQEKQMQNINLANKARATFSNISQMSPQPNITNFKSKQSNGKVNPFLQKMNSQLTLNAKPFMKGGNTNKSMGSYQAVNAKSTQNLHMKQQHSHQSKELNEKNLYLFDKQQNELFDKQQYWNKIFLNNSNSGQVNNTVSDLGNQNVQPSIFNSQSMFCFPIGLDVKKKKPNAKQSDSKGDMFTRSDHKHRNSFGMLDKRKSIPCTTQRSPRPFTNKNEADLGPLTPHKIQSNGNKMNYQNALTQSSDIKLAQVNIHSSNKSSANQPVLNTRFMLNKKANNSEQQLIENEFDRKSAGERFGGNMVSIYQELQKINKLFNSSQHKRRNSCSHSQSHSRVRAYQDEQTIGLLNIRKKPEKMKSYLDHALIESPMNVSENVVNKTQMEPEDQI